VNPVIAVLLGTVLLGEPFRPSMLVAGAVIVAGIAIVQAPRHLLRRRPRVRPAVQNGRA
jgi:drug/metabolite transporter (DMT)-like permease